MNSNNHSDHYVICINNRGYKGSLEVRKLYQTLPDPEGEKMGMIRVIDEEEEDYLYPADWFVSADLSSQTIHAMEEAPERTNFSKYFENVPESTEERDALVKEFNEAMMDIYKKAKSEAGYTATRYLSMLHEHGGLQTARLLLESKEVSEGYTALWERGRLDLTVEALVFNSVKFQWLFTTEEQEAAKERLEEYQYQPALAHA